MNEFDTIQIIYLIGWLVLAGSALAAFQLSWKKGIKLALIWACIFVGVFFVFSLVQ